MRILHFVSHFSLLSETFIYDEILLLEKIRPRSNTILTSERRLAQERPYHSVEVLNQQPSFIQNLRRRYLKHLRRIRIPRQNFPLYAYLHRHLDAFDLVHVHFAWNVLPFYETLKLMGWEHRKPIVVQCQGTDIISNPVRNSDYKKQLLEIAARDNVFFTANSEFLQQKMIDLGIAPAKIRLVRNAFNTDFPAHRKQKFFQAGDCFKVINTARFIGWKGQIHLVRGFARFVSNVYENSQLTLVGDGETLSQVKAAAEREGISKHVKFVGSVAHQDLAKLLSEHDLYVQPSIIDPQTFQQEGLPVAVVEALAVGLPLIVTRTGGMPEIVGEDNTFARIIPAQDSEAIYVALKEMFEDGSCFQDTSAYSKKRLAAFSQENQLEELQRVYQGAWNKRPSRTESPGGKAFIF